MPAWGGTRALVAADEGKMIPLGWALNKRADPTTDPKAGLEGSMLPADGFGASSFFVDEGDKPRTGRAFLVIDPEALAGTEVYHIETPALRHAAGRK
jgi:(2R)-3-sulfolactate dehydrogenase (NADP+)